MIFNYLKIALRNLKKRSGFSFINIFGLATGITSCLLLVLYVQDEWSYDRFHEDGENIYRIAGSYDQGGDERNESAVTTFLLAPELESIPGIEKWSRLQFSEALVEQGDLLFQEENVMIADSTFFNIFTFPLIKGNPTKVLKNVNSIVISEAMAKKYFGNDEPIGQSMEVDDLLVEVTGVMENFPSNSHFLADFVISMNTMVPHYPDWVLTNNSGTSHYTYIRATSGVSIEELESGLGKLVERFYPHDGPPKYFIQPLESIHLKSNLSGEIMVNGDIVYTYIFLTIAVLILVIACINYMNLAIAKSASRAKEVGLRKIVGATKYQLVSQHLTESIVLSVFAVILGGLLTELLLPYFNQLSGKTIEQSIITDLYFVLLLLTFGIVVGLFSGSYPAFYLSHFKALKTLKGEQLRLKGGALSFRKTLVIFQFVATAVLIIGTIFIREQLDYMHNKKLGIDTNNVLYFSLPNNEIRTKQELIKNDLLSHTDFTSVSMTNNNPTARVGHWRTYKINEKQINIPTAIIGYDYFETLNAELVSGRSFSRDYKSDETQAYVLNESAANFLELKEGERVGTHLIGWAFTGSKWSEKEATIVGVVKDFHFTSLHTKIQPVVFSLGSEITTPMSYMIVRFESSHLEETLATLQQVWAKHTNEYPLDFAFLQDEVNQLYQSEQRFLKVFVVFSILAILVACLGALSLISYTVSKMTKQIGIRKVLGAPLWDIVKLVNQSFFVMIGIAFLIAIPISHYFVSNWLETFEYRINVGWVPYLQATLTIALIAILTTSFQSLKAANTNPVDVLKDN